ncbi:Transthyretin-like family protein [Ancylostoma caninum]|uniref:Transthyretin-like family protein n=1 Tax=Ancylostoma caninum TaxID=29170 RepID=A0A368GBF9_ANCCA|nr:Transthyretin-like family protein [Ancylostoma caninum]
MKLLMLAFFISSTSSVPFIGSVQSVAVTGKLNCNGEPAENVKLCVKKLSIKIPKNYVTEGETPTKVFEIGDVNLAGEFSGESTDCFN